MVFWYVAYSMFAVWLAAKDASFIAEGQAWRINHFRNGLIHISFASLMGILYGAIHILGFLCLARVVFNLSINLFRGLSPFYVSPNPKSWVDRGEKWIFGDNGVIPNIIYTLILFAIWVTR